MKSSDAPNTNTDRCTFDRGGVCYALSVKKCEGCKFRKTDMEYKEGLHNAVTLLNKKGLQVVERKEMRGGKIECIMSTVKGYKL